MQTGADTVRRTLHPKSDASPAFAASCCVGGGLLRFSVRPDRHGDVLGGLSGTYGASPTVEYGREPRTETHGGRSTPRETVFLQCPARQLESACAAQTAMPASAANAVVPAR